MCIKLLNYKLTQTFLYYIIYCDRMLKILRRKQARKLQFFVSDNKNFFSILFLYFAYFVLHTFKQGLRNQFTFRIF